VFTTRLGNIVAQLDSGERPLKEDAFVLAWRERIRERQEDHRTHVMMLVQGDVRNYEAMMEASCETYLIAMEAYVKKIKLSQPEKKGPTIGGKKL
jgi:hypothetical protein